MPAAQKKPLAFLLGVTASHAFTVGPLLLSLRRHISRLDYEVIVISDDLAGKDADLISLFPACRIIPYEPLIDLRPALPPDYPIHYLYRLEIFRLLESYKAAIWLDTDIAIQGDVAPLAGYGPFAMASPDNSFLKEGLTYRMGHNFFKPVEGYDMKAEFSNAGIMVARDSLPKPLKLYEWCMRTFEEHHPVLRLRDQALLNMFAQKFPELFRHFPADEYNCFPLKPASKLAKIVHCFGEAKFWNDGLMNLCFPEWQRDYQTWKMLGGSAYSGPVTNAGFTDQSTYQFMSALLDRLNRALER